MPDEELEKKLGKGCDRLSFLSFSAKKLAKQVDRFQVQLSEEKSRNRELSTQLTEAADYKVCIQFQSVLSHNRINPNASGNKCMKRGICVVRAIISQLQLMTITTLAALNLNAFVIPRDASSK